MGVRHPLWGTGREPTGTARHTLAPLSELQEPRRVGGAVTATGLAGHKGARPRRGGLTGEPLGASRRTGWGTRMMAEGVGRRNLSCTGKPRGLRHISGRTRGGDQANRLTEAAPVGVPAARRCRGGRHLSNEGRKPGPAPWGLPPPGPASVPPRGRAWPRALPRQREGGLPGRGVSESPGREAPKEWRRPKGSTGEGTPRRDPGGPAGRSRPKWEGGGHQTATATAATAYLWRRGPATQGQPRPSPGPDGARCPGKPPGRPPAKQGRSPTASCERSRGGGQRGPRALRPWNLRASGMPLSRRAHPYPPRPPAGGFGLVGYGEQKWSPDLSVST